MRPLSCNAVYLIKRLEVGKDGTTAYERVKGEVASLSGPQFGEQVLFMTATMGKMMAKLRSMWDYGIFVGVRPQSNHIWVAIAKNHVEDATFQEDVRWSKNSVRWFPAYDVEPVSVRRAGVRRHPTWLGSRIAPSRNEGRSGTPRF